MPGHPKIFNKFICISNIRTPEIAAIVLSYISIPDHYIPLFEFPTVTKELHVPEDSDKLDEHSLSLTRGRKKATYINNSIASIGGCEFLILIGLTPLQKSYLYFAKNMSTIEIDDISEIDFYLSSLGSPMDELRCRSSEIFKGLFRALKEKKILKIDESADLIEIVNTGSSGLILLENAMYVSTVVGVNYAYSINADLELVEFMIDDEEMIIQEELSDWKNNSGSLKNIKEQISKRISHINFKQYSFSTFFTSGLPYSLILKNVIPFSYVNLRLNPDLFIINNIVCEGKLKFGSAVIFSPQYFKSEECTLCENAFIRSNFFVRNLFNENATVEELDLNLKEFPYDVFHICSHGGEILGSLINEEFIDSDGNPHNVEYESVLSISPRSQDELFLVQHKTFFKKFDGLKWKSKELKDKYPHYVFSDMQNAMSISKASKKKVLKKSIVVTNSCGISAIDGIHQGMLETLSAHSSPFIFNNTCWSWGNIAESFLDGGARGYIGTLWNISHDVAVNFAEVFYNSIFNDTILNTFHQSLKSIDDESNQNIYIYWGLHFSCLTPGISQLNSRYRIFQQIMRSFFLWNKSLSKNTNEKSTKMTKEFMNWLMKEMQTTFLPEYNAENKIVQEIKRKLKDEK